MGSVNPAIGSIGTDIESALLAAEIVPAEATEEQRKFFTFYWSYYDSIRNLPDSMQLVLYRAIIVYSLDFIEPDFSAYEEPGTLRAVWAGLLPSLKRNRAKYLAGLKGGAPAGNLNSPNGRRGNKQQSSNNQATIKQGRNKKEENRNTNNEGKEDRNDEAPLVFPYSSQKFMETWEALCSGIEWKKKSKRALQIALNKLKPYPEAFAIILMEDAIEHPKWQSVVFDGTPAKYQIWLQAEEKRQQTPMPGNDGGGWKGTNLNQESL